MAETSQKLYNLSIFLQSPSTYIRFPRYSLVSTSCRGKEMKENGREERGEGKEREEREKEGED
uniref:Uncharacterized protein n=1 Tax=Nelumbo nucifera TaxID=4432 RepID=A0A822Y7J1_NELNU|nr:TPA_asm: hypothetical protein HUJ06_028757 [Nelumbo nucifera]